MALLLVFVGNVLIGQAAAVFIALTVEHYLSPYAGLLTFMALYLVVFWAAWRLALKLTEPRAETASRDHSRPAVSGR
jgi:hypothetical protein